MPLCLLSNVLLFLTDFLSTFSHLNSSHTGISPKTTLFLSYEFVELSKPPDVPLCLDFMRPEGKAKFHLST